MKRSFLLISAALLAGALTAPVMAQENPNLPVTTRYGENHSYVEHFDSYLDAHPDVARDLRKDPRLIDDPRFVRNHPELHGYLQKHPEMTEDFRAHPDRFMHREHRYDRSESRWDRRHDHDGDRG
jgi:hypothetical protein